MPKISGDDKAMKSERRQEMENVFIVHNHASTKRAIKMLGQSTWDSFYKFTIERHPYEKCVSWAWQKKGQREMSEALEYSVEQGKYRNYDLYTLNGKVSVDFIIRYENMQKDLKIVEEKLGLEIFSRLPNAKSEEREDKRPASIVLNDAQKAAIRTHCAEEFALMGYAE